jgi:hypothetical protein
MYNEALNAGLYALRLTTSVYVSNEGKADIP